ITYHMGPGATKVRLKVKFSWDMVPLYNVIATLKGAVYPDQWVIRGNHMDGWVFGATDPLSGNSAMIEEAYAIGQLARSGWKPKRTILYASWDGEEQGLIGSTEWVEKHAEELRKKAVVYINSDSNNRGFLNVGGSHSLQHFVNDVGQYVTDPQTEVSVIERARARQMVRGDKKAAQGQDLPIYPLGSGSDYTPFLQHIGISSLNIGYGGEGGGGVYHSRYDSYDHLKRFGDPNFAYGLTLSQTTGRVVLRFANADILPHRFSDMAQNIGTYLDELKEMMESMREETKFDEKLHQSNAYVLAADPEKPYYAPQKESQVPFINFTPMENAVEQLTEITSRYDNLIRTALKNPEQLTKSRTKSLNDLIQSIEQNLTDPKGLPRRPWYRHRIYAPGYYTGYGVKTLPAIREAIEERNWEEATSEIVLTADAITRYKEEIAELVGILE